MFDVTVESSFAQGFMVDGGNRIFEPGSYQFPHWSGYHQIHLGGMGDIVIFDLGEDRLKPYDNPRIPWTQKQWGGLIRYRGLDAYFRYDGTGLVQIKIDRYGSIDLHFKQGGMMVRIDDLTVS